MPDVSIFNVAGTSINVKDATARSQAANALSTATAAQSTANTAKTTATAAQSTANTAKTTATAAQSTATQALNLAQSIEDLTRVEVTYESASETIKITNGTHES